MPVAPVSAPQPSSASAWRCVGHCAVALLIVTTIWVVYWPSMGIFSGADHLDYLINIFGHHSTWDIFAHTYSYNRTRIVGPGDTMCFRPLFFAWLAWQQAWYEAHLPAWQATGVWLHCLVCYLMFRILRIAGRAGGNDSAWKFLMAVIATLFFALNPNVVVMIVWTHINAYMVFVICTLVALELLIRLTLDGKEPTSSSRFQLAGAWLLICAAAFTYELGQFLAVLAGLFLLWTAHARAQTRRGILQCLAFSSIALLYQLANAVDQRIHAGLYQPDLGLPTILGKACSRECLEHALRLLAYCFAQPFFPQAFHATASGRLQVHETDWGAMPVNGWTLVSFLVIAALLGLTILAGYHALSGGQRTFVHASALVAVLLLVYLALIVCGRMNIRPSPEVLQANAYYAYTPLLLFLVGLGFLWLTTARDTWGVPWRVLWGVQLACLLLLSCIGAKQTREVTTFHALKSPGCEGVALVQTLVREHGRDPGFGIAFDAAQERIKGVPLLSILFNRYENNRNPSHVVWWRNSRFLILPWAEYAHRRPRSGTPLFPELVKLGADYHIYFFADKYQAVLYNETRWRVASNADTIAQAESDAINDLRRGWEAAALP